MAVLRTSRDRPDRLRAWANTFIPRLHASPSLAKSRRGDHPFASMGARPSRLRGALPYLTVVLIALLVCPSLLVGLPPHSHDHNFHLANAVETERLLRGGRLVGWSDFQFGGHLANGFYPPAVSAAIAALHWIARGRLSWDAAYSIVVLAFLVTYAISIFALVRRIAGAWPAVATAAVALLWDRGALFNGGWYFYLNLGVWPFGFCVAWVLAALAVLPRTFNERGVGRVWAVAVFSALAVLTHPFALMVLPVLAGLQFVVWAAMGRIQLRGMLRAAVALGLGLALSAWWWAPFMLRSGELEKYAVPPVSVPLFLELLSKGSGGDLVSWWVLPGALVGTWLAWREREPWGRWCGLAGWGLMLFSTEIPYLPLRVDLQHGWLATLQLVRLQAVGRLFLMALAVRALFEAAKYARRRFPGFRRSWLVGAGAAAACGVAALLLAGKLKVPRSGAPHRPTCYSRSEEIELRELLDALKPRLQGRRLAVGDGDHCLVLSVSLIEVPFFKIGRTPASLFGGKFSTEDPVVLGRVGVAALIGDAPIDGPLAGLPVIERRGRFEARALEPLARIEASDPAARVSVRHWSDEEIRLQLDAPGETDLRLWVNFSPQWKAAHEGQPLPVNVAPIGEARLIQLRSPPGAIRLQFAIRPSTRVCQAISLLAVAAMLGSLARRFVRKRVVPYAVGESPG